jgi:hypothetical protein
MGSRFDSDIRSKDHIKPRKKDGPGPGSYELHSSIKLGLRDESKRSKQITTWGKAERDWSNLPKNTPAPNHYLPTKFTEASH